jgi:hypothetical protein
MALIQVTGHEQVMNHVLQNFKKTREFIDVNINDEGMSDEIVELATRDLQQALVLILDNLGRQKAI